MNAKFIYVMLAVLLMGSQVSLVAQNKNNKGKKTRPSQEQLLQMQANQMVKILMLDDATAAKFTPVYENYMKELRDCRMMNRKPKADKNASGQTETKPAQKSVPTDAEVEKKIKGQFAQSRKMLDIREDYYNKFRKILSPKQIAKIYQIEKSNAKKFRKEFERRKNQSSRQVQRPFSKRQVSKQD